MAMTNSAPAAPNVQVLSGNADADQQTDSEAKRENPVDVSRLDTKQQVLDRLGLPRDIETSGDKWTYDDRIIIFRDDRVAGWVTAVTGQQATGASSRTTDNVS